MYKHLNLSNKIYRYMLCKLYKMGLDKEQDMHEHESAKVEIVEQLHEVGEKNERQSGSEIITVQSSGVLWSTHQYPSD